MSKFFLFSDPDFYGNKAIIPECLDKLYGILCRCSEDFGENEKYVKKALIFDGSNIREVDEKLRSKKNI